MLVQSFIIISTSQLLLLTAPAFVNQVPRTYTHPNHSRQTTNEVNLDCDHIKGFISNDVWFMIDPYRDVDDGQNNAEQRKLSGAATTWARRV